MCKRRVVAAEATILHADAFFASVEQRDDPRPRGRAVIAGGGVVLAASYEAKAYGVRTAMGGRQARRLCPHALVVAPRMAAYAEASRALYALFEDTTPSVEGLSIDEAFLDIRGMERIAGTPRDIAVRLRRTARERLGLPSPSASPAPSTSPRSPAQSRSPTGSCPSHPETSSPSSTPTPDRADLGDRAGDRCPVAPHRRHHRRQARPRAGGRIGASEIPLVSGRSVDLGTGIGACAQMVLGRRGCPTSRGRGRRQVHRALPRLQAWLLRIADKLAQPLDRAARPG